MKLNLRCLSRLALLSTLALTSLQATSQTHAAEPLEIVFVDVMGGAATLICTPEGETILLDSGWPGLDDRDPKRIVYVLKEVLKKEKLDHLLSTHWHTDHYGGVEGLAKRVEIGRFWDRGLPEDPGVDPANFPDGPKMDDKLGIAYRAASKGKRTVLKAGDHIPLKGDMKVTVLAASTVPEGVLRLGEREGFAAMSELEVRLHMTPNHVTEAVRCLDKHVQDSFR